MEVNYLGVLLATVAQIVMGFVWYGPVFGKLWSQMHGFDKLPKATQQKMMKEMGPIYGVQFAVSAVTAYVLAMLLNYLPGGWNAFGLAGWLWLGFVMPFQTSSVLFSGTESKWLAKKILVQVFGSLAFLMAAAAALSAF